MTMPLPSLTFSLRALALLSTLAACRTPCEERSTRECDDDSDCNVIRGRPADEELMCFQDVTPAGCGEFDICGAAITFARDPEGKLWRFSSTCVPSGYEHVVGSSSGDGSSSWPSCDELPQDAP